LQSSIFPGAEDIHEIEQRCGLEIVSYFAPSSEIGGDFWGIKSVSPEDTALWMVDFSGHGVASALNAFRLQAYVKDYSTLSAKPGDYLTHMNDKLMHLLLPGQFATMFYGVLDHENDKLHYAAAATPHPMILRANGEVETLDGCGVPLGINMNLYHTVTEIFLPGDMLLLYSDALIESADSSGAFLSEHDIVQTLKAHHLASAATLMNALLGRFQRHAHGKLADDLTLLICKRSASAKGVS
jgi:sigma-B regulation protein RsbU (phosphoserine phosphatase)